MKVDEDWKNSPGEYADTPTMFMIVLLGIIRAGIMIQSPAGESGQRRRLRGKQTVPAGRYPLAVVPKPGLLDTSTEGAMDNIEINGHALSRTKPN
eukprot:307922-Pyramimonas_sp.AAC.1